jgi:hypothetical protein
MKKRTKLKIQGFLTLFICLSLIVLPLPIAAFLIDRSYNIYIITILLCINYISIISFYLLTSDEGKKIIDEEMKKDETKN